MTGAAVGGGGVSSDGRCKTLPQDGNGVKGHGGEFLNPRDLNVMLTEPKAAGADARDNTWGVRWSGMTHEINYSLSYLKTFNPVPVISMKPLPPIAMAR